MAEDPRLDLLRYCKVLDVRAQQAEVLDSYRNGVFPLPPLISDSKLSKAYRLLMDLSSSNWPGLIVGAAEERLEVLGVRFGDKPADDDAWTIWQANALDAEASMLHDSVLTTGRAYAIVWGDGSANPQPRITLEHASMCLVEYEPGPTRMRRGALRRWQDGDRWLANVYKPEAIYKFQSMKGLANDAKPEKIEQWEPRQDPGDNAWPLTNPLGVVPVVEFAVNRTLEPAPFGTGLGDFATNLRHIDRINYKVFSGLVALTWSGFPIRYLIGDPILYEKDEQGQDRKDAPIPPAKALADAFLQLENPDAKVGQLPEADISNYSPDQDIEHLAALTKTPANYLLGKMVNVSADALRAAEAGLISKVRRHHRSLGEAWEETLRLAFRVRSPGDPRGKDLSAQVIWKDPESRSMAERADAAAKLATILPQKAILQYVLQMTPQEVNRYQAEGVAQSLMAAIAQNVPNTNGAGGARIGNQATPANGNGT